MTLTPFFSGAFDLIKRVVLAGSQPPAGAATGGNISNYFQPLGVPVTLLYVISDSSQRLSGRRDAVCPNGEEITSWARASKSPSISDAQTEGSQS